MILARAGDTYGGGVTHAGLAHAHCSGIRGEGIVGEAVTHAWAGGSSAVPSALQLGSVAVVGLLELERKTNLTALSKWNTRTNEPCSRCGWIRKEAL
jgi:hypothetical protein